MNLVWQSTHIYPADSEPGDWSFCKKALLKSAKVDNYPSLVCSKCRRSLKRLEKANKNEHKTN